MSEYVVETVNLTKKYDGFTAVNNLNLRVQQGESLVFSGRMGPGRPPPSSCFWG